MTISSTIRTAGPFTGDGIATSFPFNFKIFNENEIVLVQTIAGVDTTLALNADYGVILNADQNAAPGGQLISKVGGVTTPLAVGYVWNATSNVQNLQPINLTNNGGFFPRVINDGLDRLTILCQQLVRAASNSLQYPLSDGGMIANLLPGMAARLGKVLAFDPVTGAPIISNQTLAQIEAGSDNAAASAAAAAISAGNAATSAGIATTQAGIATTQAGIATTQAGIATTAANIAVSVTGYRYSYLTNQAATDPGAGNLKFNATPPSAATMLFISETTGSGQTISADLATWDDSTSAVRGRLRVVKATDPSIFLLYDITGTITDSGTWDRFAITYVTGNGSFANNDPVAIGFTRTGDAGQSGSVPFTSGAGTVDAITANFTPDIALANGQLCVVQSTGANTITNPTFSPDGLTAHTIVKKGGGALVAGDTGSAGYPMLLEYNLANTRWELMNPAKIVSADISGAIVEAKGGTNQTTYAQGDILYASAANTLSKLAIGSINQVYTVQSGGVPGWSDAVALGTPVAISGTFLDFSIPSSAKNIYLNLSGVSTTGTSPIIIQLGYGLIASAGYLGGTASISTSTASSTNSTQGAQLFSSATTSSSTQTAGVIISLTSPATNRWGIFGTASRSDASVASSFSYTTTLVGNLTTVRITTVNGTDTFDAGTVNVTYQ